MFDEYKDQLEKDIKVLDNQIKSLSKYTAKEMRRLNGIKQEKEKRLNNLMTNGIHHTKVVGKIDSHYDNRKAKNDTKQAIVESNIQSLETQKENITTRRANRVVSKKLARQQDKLKRLKRKRNRLKGRQRFFMMPRILHGRFVDRVAGGLIGRKDYVNDLIADNTTLQSNLDLNKRTDRIKDFYIDLKSSRLALSSKGYDKAIKALDKARVNVTGSRIRSIPRRVTKRLKKNFKSAYNTIKSNVKNVMHK